MINLILSIIVGAAGYFAASFIFESIGACVFVSILFFIAGMIVFNRMTQKKLMAIMNKANDMMQNIPKLPSEIARANLIEKCIEEFKGAYKYKNYTFFLEQQLNSQIGSIYYAQRKFDEAEPYLRNSFIRNGPSICMYACLLFKKGDDEGMVAQFEKAVKFTPRMPVLWNLYAWCLMERKKRDEAIAVLNRCLKVNPGDKITKENLDLAKNGGKIKMRGYQEQWYQFWLEDPVEMQREMQKLLLDKHSVVRGR